MEGDFPEEIKCPICFELPTKEIFQCKNGHTVCSNCANSLSQCPQCRVPFEQTKIRNRALESLLDSMRFDCTNKTSGCTVKLKRKEFTEHTDRCLYSGARGTKPSAPPASPPQQKKLSVRRPPVPPKPKVKTCSSSDTSSSLSDSSPDSSWASLAGLSLQPYIQNGSVICNVGNTNVTQINGQTWINGQLVKAGGHGSNCGNSIVTVNGQTWINGQLVQTGSFQSTSQQHQKDFEARRDKTLYFGSAQNAVVTGNGGHIVNSGTGKVTVIGSPQSVKQSGTGETIIEGNVTEGIVLSGIGKVAVCGNASGGITLSGMGTLKVDGNVYGNVTVSGVGSVKINGRHYNGSVFKSGCGSVTINN